MAPAEDLIGSIGQVVDAAIRIDGVVPDDCWERSTEDRTRPLRELARHLFDVVEKGVDADVLSMFPAGTWLTNQDQPTLGHARRMTRYGAAVRAKFAAWYAAPLDRPRLRAHDRGRTSVRGHSPRFWRERDYTLGSTCARST